MTAYQPLSSVAVPSSNGPTIDAARDRPVLERLEEVVDRAVARPLPDGAATDDAPPPALWLVECSGEPVPIERAKGSKAGVVVLCEGASAQHRMVHHAHGAALVLDSRRATQDLARAITRLAGRGTDAATEPTLDDVNSRSNTMRALLRDARRTAKADTSLLMTGETGVGKEFLARAIHASGPRRGKPFVVINCCALPENLLESQLFGHERGAFTGADRTHKGFFEIANGGTLLLDEIGEMPLHLQVKLLTVLERQEVLRVGSHTPIPVDVRVMAATNRDIEAEVARGTFRDDLFYRLNVIHLHVPPLWRRAEDVPDLAGGFVREHCAALGLGEFQGIDETAMHALLTYRWPGNVRELRNALERSLVLNGTGRITFDDLPQEIRNPSSKSPSGGSVFGSEVAEWDNRTLREVREAAVAAAERAYLARLLEQTGGRVGKTAERAGIRPRSLYDRMKQHGLRKEQFRNRR